jgi:hypothetical protein
MTEKLPGSRLIFSDTTKDGLLTMTVWLDPAAQTDLMRENGIEAMGILTVYYNKSLLLAHEERVPLSESAVYGSGPTEQDTQIWDQVIERFYTDFDKST